MQSDLGDNGRVDDEVEMEEEYEQDEGITANTTTIFDMIANHHWDPIMATTDTDVLSQRHPPTGQYPLHALCGIGAAVPVELIRHVAASYPAAIAAPEPRYGDTCLHILGRQSPHTLNEKLAALLPYTPPATIGLRNHFGGTVLHVAVHHNATIDTLALLLRTYPPVLNVRTPERRHAVEILYAGFCATIHGHVHICKLLEYHDAKRYSVVVGGGDGDRPPPQSSIFDRFWNKVRLLALTAFFQSDRSTRLPSSLNASAGIHHTSDDDDDDDQYLVHGLLLCGDVPDQLLRLALQMVGPAAVLARDVNGNTPLHHYVQKAHRFTIQGSSNNKKNLHRTAIRVHLKRAAGVRNREHFLPLHLAIRDRLPYEDYWGIISLNGGSNGNNHDSNDGNNNNNTTTRNNSHSSNNNDLRHLQPLDMSDPVTQLPPALLAASLGGKEAVNTCFCLLRNHPEQIKRVVVVGQQHGC